MTHSAISSNEGRGERPPDSTSASLLGALKRGDDDAWRRTEYLYTPLVRRWCRRHGLRHQDKNEVVQDVFVTVHEIIADFQRQRTGSFRLWLRRITEYKILDWRRKEEGQPKAPGGTDFRKFLENLAAGVRADPTDPDEPTERIILVRRAMQLVQSEFEPRTWQAAGRVLVDGQRPKDVAEELKISAGAVRTAKARVLARLRQVLGDLLDGEESSER